MKSLLTFILFFLSVIVFSQEEAKTIDINLEPEENLDKSFLESKSDYITLNNILMENDENNNLNIEIYESTLNTKISSKGNIVFINEQILNSENKIYIEKTKLETKLLNFHLKIMIIE